MNENQPIDIVITWVDGDDPQWLKEYNKHSSNFSGKEEASHQRYKSLDSLKYIFRGIEKFMPWVRHVHLVTFGHYPDWLNLNHEKLKLVKHEDIFPDQKLLPVFNSGTIEMNFDNISGLSEKFIYFNDDMFVVGKVEEEDFFKNGLPCDFLKIVPLMHADAFSHRLHEQMMLVSSRNYVDRWSPHQRIRKMFNAKYGVKTLFLNGLFYKLKHYPLFEINHHPQPYLKSNVVDAKKCYGDQVAYTLGNKFRTKDTLSQYIFRFHALAKGEFHPQILNGRHLINYSSFMELERKLSEIQNDSATFVCFNDDHKLSEDDFSKSKELMLEYFHNILDDKSCYELAG